MITRKSFGLLALAGLAASALLSGCGGSSSSDTVTSIPTSATVFYAHSVAFKNSTSQTLYAWGYNSFGQLGIGNLENQTVAVRVPTPVPVDRVAAGGDHTLALPLAFAFANVSSVYAWGSNNSGQIGQPTTTGADAYSSSPVKVPLGGVVTDIAAGGFHSLAVVDGGVRGWGFNLYGQLGDNSITNSISPVVVRSTEGNLPIIGVSAVAAGSTYSLALSDGKVYAWGNNAKGQLGTDPALPFRSTAALVQADGVPLTGVAGIAAGGSTSYALKSDGTVWAWGYNGMGQLGLPANAEANHQPVQILFGQLGNVTVIQISAGLDHVLARLSDGTIAAWGFNGYGQLGNNDTSNTRISTPARVLTDGSGVPGSGTPMDRVTDIIAFGNHSLARSNGVWYGWGNNGNGQLGRPISTSGEGFFRVPAPVAGL